MVKLIQLDVGLKVKYTSLVLPLYFSLNFSLNPIFFLPKLVKHVYLLHHVEENTVQLI